MVKDAWRVNLKSFYRGVFFDTAAQTSNSILASLLQVNVVSTVSKNN